MMDSCTGSEAIVVRDGEVFVVECVAFVVVGEMGKSEIVVVVVSGGVENNNMMRVVMRKVYEGRVMMKVSLKLPRVEGVGVNDV